MRMPLVAVVLLLAGLLGGCKASIPENELQERVHMSRPAWENYQEDIKSQIGAGPVAEWAGRPVEVRCERNTLFVTFHLSGPWAHRDAAIPVLIRDPQGRIHENMQAKRRDGEVTYLFGLPESAAPFPWIELRFPHGNRRVVLSAKGQWKEPPESVS